MSINALTARREMGVEGMGELRPLAGAVKGRTVDRRGDPLPTSIMAAATVIHRCRRCERDCAPGELRYIRLRVVRVEKGSRWVRETTQTPTEIGPYCPSCLPNELDPE